MIMQSILENDGKTAHDRGTAAMPVDFPSVRKPWVTPHFVPSPPMATMHDAVRYRAVLLDAPAW
jgi:hypothetical protein